MIFGTPLISPLVRKVIRAQHSELYSGLMVNRTKSTGKIFSGEEFLRLIHYGGLKKQPPQIIFYTYVILENKFQFSETGSGFLKDFSSKHAMHSKCSKSLFFAGEFHIRPLVEGEDIGYKLVIDNNSGTYAPNPDCFPFVEELFRRNFPGLEIECLEFNNPKLIQYREGIKH